MIRIASVLAALALASPAAAFIAENGLVVEPETSGTFNVPYRGEGGARAFWCAAGDYAVRELGLAPDTAIYRLSSPPRRSGQGIRFGLSPEGAKPTGLLLLSGGKGVSAAFARQLCDLPRVR